MAELQFPNVIGSFLQGQHLGQQVADRRQAQQTRSRISELASLAYGAAPDQRQQILGEAVGVDPEAGLALSRALGSEDDAREKRLLTTARLIDAAPVEQKAAIFQNVRPQIAQYLPGLPEAYDDQVGQGIKAFIQSRTKVGETPTGFRQFELTANAAGLKPGTLQYEQAARIALGSEGRAASGGFSFDTVKGADGRERLLRRNPRTGVNEVFDERVQDFVPLGGGGQLGLGAGGSPGVGGYTAGTGAASTRVDIAGIDPQTQQRIANVTAVMAQNGIAEDQVNAWVASQLPQAGGTPAGSTAATAAPAITPSPSRSGLGVSRTPEEEAAAKRIAEDQAALTNYDAMTDAITRRETATTTARKTAEQDAERTGKQTQRAFDAQTTLDLLDQAEQLLPNATGSVAGTARDQALGTVGISTPGAQATAQLNLIASQLVSKVPRFEGPQSNIDVQFYREAARPAHPLQLFRLVEQHAHRDQL